MTRTDYTPGVHAVVDLEGVSRELLSDPGGLAHLWNALIKECGLTKLSDFYHVFENEGGFTGVICLTESHLSIHTWPEYGRVTFDVFLSNYQKVNDGHSETIVEKTCTYFNGRCTRKNLIRR